MLNGTIIKQTNRQTWLDIAKGIGILLVILGHTNISREIQEFIYIFHMPLFFVISGYLFNLKKWKYRWRAFVKTRFKRLMFPYFLLSICVFYPFWVITAPFMNRNGSSLPPDYLKDFIGIFYASPINHYMDFNGAIWFLPSLFISEIIFFIILKLTDSKWKQVLLFIFVAYIGYNIHFYYILPWGADIAMVVQIFLAVGFYLRNGQIKISLRLTLISLILLGIAYFYNAVDTSSRHYGILWLYFLGGVSGTMVVFFISKLLSCMNVNVYLSYLGKESLAILFWQRIGLLFSPFVLQHILHFSYKEAHSSRLFFLEFVVAISFCLCIVYLKNRLRTKFLSNGYTCLAIFLNW